MSLLLAAQGAPQATLTRDESIPVESLQSLVLSVSIPVESILGRVLDGSIPVEAGGVFGRQDAIPVDSTAVQAVVPVFDRNVFDPAVFATGLQLDRDEGIPIDTSDNFVTLNRDESIPVETRFTVLRRDEGIPIDNAGQPVGRQRRTVTQFIAWFQGSPVFQVDQCGDFAKYFQGSPVLTLEARILLELGQAIPVDDVIGRAASGGDIPVDSTGQFARDEAIPVESITSATVITRDETIPVESSTVPVAPSDLLVFYGGGASWPPSWLVRAPLLNRTQHNAVIYIGGTSWSRFTGSAPPPRPSRMVKPVKPRRIRRPRPTPAHPGYVRAAHSSIIWVGGRSTESTRDRAAVMKQDEEDFMTLLPLL